MKRVLILAVVGAMFGCRSGKCSGDIGAIDDFNRNYSLIKVATEDSVEVNADEYRHALIFLSAVTGINTRGEYGSTLGYKNIKYYKSDMKAWRAWLSKNRCKLTSVYIDSVLAIGLRQDR